MPNISEFDICCTNSGGLGHWLLHVKANRTTARVFGIKAVDVAVAVNVEVPILQGAYPASLAHAAKKILAIRKLLWSDHGVAEAVFKEHSEFLVAPEDWTPKVKAAWGLDNPPTPYELACAILQQPTRNFWGLFPQNMPMFKKCALSTLRWWLMGMPIDILGSVLCKKDPNAEQQLVIAIKHIMDTPKLAFWALGIDPMPMVTNRDMATAALYLLEGMTLPRKPGLRIAKRRYTDAQDKLIKHPAVKAALQSGYVAHPMDRPLYADGIVFQSKHAKMEWIASTTHPWAKHARRAQETVKRRKQRHGKRIRRRERESRR